MSTSTKIKHDDPTTSTLVLRVYDDSGADLNLTLTKPFPGYEKDHPPTGTISARMVGETAEEKLDLDAAAIDALGERLAQLAILVVVTFGVYKKRALAAEAGRNYVVPTAG